MNERILFIEALMGVSGDMLLGAFLDLGVPVEALHEAWDALDLDNYEVRIYEVQKSGMRALQCEVRTDEKQGPRSWKAYQDRLKSAALKPAIKAAAIALCKKVFEIEASIHRSSLQKLHLHEMGGSDLLIDVVGTLAAVDTLAPGQVFASSINTGKGFVRFSHGKYPVPVPVVTNLLVDIPVFQNEVEGELTTPTGALLLTHLAQSFGDMPAMSLENVGVGAGERDVPGHPNVVRIFQGTRKAAAAQQPEDVVLLETNIDDSNPQLLAHFMERAFEQGALDVFFTPIFMKKNRPAVRLSVLAPSTSREAMASLLFRETTAIGLRYWKVDREKLDRRWKEVKVEDYTIRIKESYRNGALYNYQPEYEDCRTVAALLGRPLKEILARAIHAYLAQSR